MTARIIDGKAAAARLRVVAKRNPLRAQLVGSVPLQDAETVFRTVGGTLGPHLRRISDGEVGARRSGIEMLSEILRRQPSFESDPDATPFVSRLASNSQQRTPKRLRVRSGLDPRTIRLETGYAAMAIDSFVIFDRLQREGVLPDQIKFQVSIPSPLSATYICIARSHHDTFLELLTNHLIHELQQIAMVLPQDRVAVQWDLLREVAIWEGSIPDRPDHYKTQIATVLGRIGDAVPKPLELGYRLFQGSDQEGHQAKPRDAGFMVEIMRTTVKHVRRPITYFHFPMPRQRVDADFLRPLATLLLPQGTELIIELTHADDIQGSKKVVELVQQFIPVAGIGSDGGSVDPVRFGELLEAIHKLITVGAHPLG